MPRTSANKLVQSQLDAGARREARFVELQLDWVRYKSGTPIARFGGLWDRLAKGYAGDATRSRVIEVHAQQIAAVELFDRWLVEHLEGSAPATDRIREIIEGDIELDAATGAQLGLSELLLSGGRRSGKTTVMEGLLASYTIAVPGSIVWTVVPSEPFHVEPKEVLEAVMPRGWYHYNGWPHFTFYLVNGSQHVIRSGHSPGAIKKGKAALVGLNEAQQIQEATYRNARGAVVDDGGFVMSALNPPTIGDVGMWTADAISQITRGDRPGGEHIFIDPLDNPHIDVRKLLAMRSGMTEHDWQTQIRGRILALPDAVLYTWDQTENERAPPDLGRITHEFLTAHEGDGVKWNRVVTVDVQGYPWVACGIGDIYRDPRAPHDSRSGLLWLTDDVALAQGDEVDACSALKAKGVDPERTLVIMDASCWWQQMERDLIRQRPNYKGRGSADIFKQEGFRHVVRPDRKMKANPDVFERIRATNASIRPADGVRGLYIDPTRCPNACESAKKWRLTKSRKPSRDSKMAHFGDVLGYYVWRFFPRRGSARKLLEAEGGTGTEGG
jgi:hypothetical protein